MGECFLGGVTVNDDHTEPKIVLRDSLGTLAVQILATREDIANMKYDVMLQKLFSIIKELKDTYHKVEETL